MMTGVYNLIFGVLSNEDQRMGGIIKIDVHHMVLKKVDNMIESLTYDEISPIWIGVCDCLHGDIKKEK